MIESMHAIDLILCYKNVFTIYNKDENMKIYPNLLVVE